MPTVTLSEERLEILRKAGLSDITLAATLTRDGLARLLTPSSMYASSPSGGFLDVIRAQLIARELDFATDNHGAALSLFQGSSKQVIRAPRPNVGRIAIITALLQKRPHKTLGDISDAGLQDAIDALSGKVRDPAIAARQLKDLLEKYDLPLAEPVPAAPD